MKCEVFADPITVNRESVTVNLHICRSTLIFNGQGSLQRWNIRDILAAVMSIYVRYLENRCVALNAEFSKHGLAEGPREQCALRESRWWIQVECQPRYFYGAEDRLLWTESGHSRFVTCTGWKKVLQCSGANIDTLLEEMLSFRWKTPLSTVLELHEREWSCRAWMTWKNLWNNRTKVKIASSSSSSSQCRVPPPQRSCGRQRHRKLWQHNCALPSAGELHHADRNILGRKISSKSLIVTTPAPLHLFALLRLNLLSNFGCILRLKIHRLSNIFSLSFSRWDWNCEHHDEMPFLLPRSSRAGKRSISLTRPQTWENSQCFLPFERKAAAADSWRNWIPQDNVLFQLAAAWFMMTSVQVPRLVGLFFLHLGQIVLKIRLHLLVKIWLLNDPRS